MTDRGDPDSIEHLRDALVAARAEAAEALADVARAKAIASDLAARNALLELQNAQMRRALYGQRAERGRLIVDQLELGLEELEASASEDEAIMVAVRGCACRSTRPCSRGSRAAPRRSQRLRAMRRMADAGYRIGLTIAPIIAAAGWEEAYAGLIADVAHALDGAADPDLTVELITHRFTAGSKAVLESWYPGSAFDLGIANRSEKRTKFGSIKHVYDADTMRRLRGFFEREIARMLPQARILYWT